MRWILVADRLGSRGVAHPKHLTAEGVGDPGDLTPEQLEDAYRLGRTVTQA